MKKIYLPLVSILMATAANAQWFDNVTYKGAFPVTDGMTGTTSNDWTAGWTNWDPQITNYPAPTTTVSSNITSNTTWTTGTVVNLVNKVFVTSGVTLTIQPGVIIRGDKTTGSALIIQKGAMIDAQGTKSSPIVFTSGEAANARDKGDWGGLIILGQAKNNIPGGTGQIEGFPTGTTGIDYGGTNDADNSGILKYVRIEFCGIAFEPNKEINGLTLGSVGSGTTLDYIQVTYSGDDSFEWFGGTVNAKHLIAFAGTDDDFDTDFGYRGNVQYALIVRDADYSDAAGDSNGFESDNDATGSYNTPMTQPIFANVTSIGPKRDGSFVLPVGEKFEKAYRIRRNSGLSLFNSIATGWEKGLSLESSTTQDNVSADTSNFEGNELVNFSAGNAKISASTAFYATFFTADGNDTTKTIANINWVNAFPADIWTTPDFRLNSASLVATGASTTLSINDMDNNIVAVTLYPNPASNNITLSLGSQVDGKATVNVVDLTGKIVFSNSYMVNRGNNTITLDINEFTNGVYFMQTILNGSVSTGKFVKK
jgi:hypothetical protein